jgi:hypothetical protein
MPKLADVNTTDLRAAIALGCRTMQSCFDADDDGTPFFIAESAPYATLAFSPDLSECHIPGRHLHALLLAEAVAGIAVDPAAIANHRRAMLRSFSGPACLPLNRQVQSGPVVNFSPVNLREGLRAVAALTIYRGDAEAQALAERYLADIKRYWNPAAGWDVPALQALGLTFQPVQGPVNGEARALGPLVEFYAATGSPAARQLADQMAELCCERFFLPDGAYTHAHFITDHTHSITSTLSGLAQYGEHFQNAEVLERVWAFYDNGLWAMRDEIGWSGGAVSQPNSDRGEAGNCGDMLETALILARHGYPAYYADVERMLRCYLLPSQLRDVRWMKLDPQPNPPDGRRDAANRMRGAWGMAAPYGHWAAGEGADGVAFHMDLVGTAVTAVCHALAQSVRTIDGAHELDLLFDYDGPSLGVVTLDAPTGLEITLKQPGPLRLRLPPWATPANVSVSGLPAAPEWQPPFLFIAQPPVGQPFRVLYPLPETTLTLSSRVHAHPIRVQLRGDRPVAMDNYGADLTYFDPLPTSPATGNT